MKLPLFVWAIFVTAILLLLALPVLAGSNDNFVACLTLIPLSLNKQPKTITHEEIPFELKEIIVGLALGDLHIRKRYQNTSLNFKQSIKNEQYIFHLYSLFQEFCKITPKIYESKLKDKIHQSIVFDILTYDAFNFYHNIFYKNNKKNSSL